VADNNLVKNYRYHHWLSDIDSIPVSAVFSFLFQDEPQLHCWKAIWGLELSCNFWTPRNDHVYIYSLGVSTSTTKAAIKLLYYENDGSYKHDSCEAESVADYKISVCGVSGTVHLQIHFTHYGV
jgi:hypothetical protein